MKKILIALIILDLLSLNSSAQVVTKIHEIGITTNNLSDFGISFKIGNEKTLLRLTALSISGNTRHSKIDTISEGKTHSIGIGLNIGFEKRKSITEKFNFYYGVDLLNSYWTQKGDDLSSDNSVKFMGFSTGIGLVIGLNYSIKSYLNISTEIIPSISYTYDKSTNISDGKKSIATNSDFDYNLNNYGAKLTLSYRF